MITTVTGKNQITIPAKLARQLGIEPGQRTEWSVNAEDILVGRLLPNRGDLAQRATVMGKAWLKEGVDPVAGLVAERATSDAEEGLE